MVWAIHGFVIDVLCFRVIRTYITYVHAHNDSVGMCRIKKDVDSIGGRSVFDEQALPFMVALPEVR